jgi:FkbM family methyltransferase
MTQTTQTTPLASLIEALPALNGSHAPGTPLYSYLGRSARDYVNQLFAGEDAVAELPPFGELDFPYFSMGAVDSLNLFDLDELIIFSFYHARRGQYRRALDIGANIGLHSIMLGRCGLEVRSFEPDPVHFAQLSRNCRANGIESGELVNAAVSAKEGSAEFIRVKGNTTGSHIAGSKSDPYGELDRFPVRIVPIAEHLAWADFVKLDAEGHEKEIILATSPSDWFGKDAMVELSSAENASAILEFFQASPVRLFSQKTNWGEVSTLEQMPFTHHDGSLFIAGTGRGPWCTP